MCFRGESILYVVLAFLSAVDTTKHEEDLHYLSVVQMSMERQRRPRP